MERGTTNTIEQDLARLQGFRQVCSYNVKGWCYDSEFFDSGVADTDR